MKPTPTVRDPQHDKVDVPADCIKLDSPGPAEYYEQDSTVFVKQDGDLKKVADSEVKALRELGFF